MAWSDRTDGAYRAVYQLDAVIFSEAPRLCHPCEVGDSKLPAEDPLAKTCSLPKDVVKSELETAHGSGNEDVAALEGVLLTIAHPIGLRVWRHNTIRSCRMTQTAVDYYVPSSPMLGDWSRTLRFRRRR